MRYIRSLQIEEEYNNTSLAVFLHYDNVAVSVWSKVMLNSLVVMIGKHPWRVSMNYKSTIVMKVTWDDYAV